MRKILIIIGHFLLAVTLTFLTQIGGFLWLLSLVVFNAANRGYRIRRFALFLFLYLLFTFLVIPYTAPWAGREKIQNNKRVSYHSWLTLLFNRNYVTHELQEILQKSGYEFKKQYPGIKIVYLDACFPFFDGFPLLPHLSHKDGKKVDIAFIYAKNDKVLTNKKPSVSGYGVFVNNLNATVNQTQLCKSQGYFQYDFTKYLTLGTNNKQLTFQPEATAFLVNLLATNKTTGKIFLEPHLRTRLKLSNSKIRFHGCGAVRHDDHLHLQL